MARSAGDDGGTAPDEPHIAQVVVEVEPLHLDRPFDYLIPDDVEITTGHRVLVAFGGRSVRGLVVGVGTTTTVERNRLRPITRRLGEHVWVRPQELDVLQWAAERYGAPLADVVRHALPPRTVDVERRAHRAGWYPPGTARRPSDPPPGPDAIGQRWAAYGDQGAELIAAVEAGRGSFMWRPLPGEDVAERLAELAQLCLAGGRDVLVIVPDPASPIADALLRDAGDLAVDLRGSPSPRVRYRRWLAARCGQARVVIGERGASFVPVDRLGLAVVFDEANPALKERRSPRYHAREVVLERARQARGVGLAIGTVPSALAWRLLRERRLTPVRPSRDAERRARPRVDIVSWTDQPRTRLSRQAIQALRDATGGGDYGVVLAARRGEGRMLVCRRCGTRSSCPTCDASLARAGAGVICEGCGWTSNTVPACVDCGAREVSPLAAGATWIGGELRRSLKVTVAVLEGYGQPAPPPPAILVMTRGSVLDTPPGRVRAVVLPDLDGSLRRPSLDATEDALRLAMNVASWTVHRRGDPAASTVVVQTTEPEHPAIAALTAWDPAGFWRAEIENRAALRFPPITTAIRLQLRPDPDRESKLREVIPPSDELLGPLPEQGWHGYLIKSADRMTTLVALRPWREVAAREGSEVRLDVDPVDAL